MAILANITLGFAVVFLAACATPQGPARSADTPLVPSTTAPPVILAPPSFSAEEGFQLAMAAYKTGDGLTALLLARNTAEQYPGTPWYKRSLFLTQRALVMLDSPPEADAAMLRVQTEYPELGDYAVFTLADYHYAKARYSRAAALYQHLVERYPGSLLRSASVLRRGLSLNASYAYAQAAEVLEQFLAENTRTDFAPVAGMALGRALTAEAALPRAVRVYQDMLVRYPGVQLDQEAEKALAELKAGGVEVPELSPSELYERGKNLFRAGQYDKALDAFTIMRERGPDAPNRPDALFRSGVALYNLNKRAEAAALLEKMVRKYPADERIPEALYWTGKAYSKLGAWDKALKAFRKILDHYPDDEWADDALYLSGNIYREMNDPGKALQYYARVAAEYPESRFADSALWWPAWSYYSRGEYRKSELMLQELLDRYPRSGLVNQAQYWQGRNAEKRGNLPKAQEYYARVLGNGPYTYYGHRAAERMAHISVASDVVAGPSVRTDGIALCSAVSCTDDSAYASETGETPLWNEETKLWLAAAPSFRTTFELMHQDMKKEAATELSSLLEKTPMKRGALIGVSKAFYELGDYYRSIMLVLRNYERMLETPARGASRDLWLLAYPQGYWDSITAYANKYGQDPYFIAALIRQESQFRAEALSPAGARGLMQVMPATGAWVAQQNSVPGFDREKLFDSDTGINIGTGYVSHLMKRFKGDPLLVAAAYNAGPDAVASWLARYSGIGERDVFVESIPYSETRGYVKKVLRNYEEYKRLYGKGSDNAPPGPSQAN